MQAVKKYLRELYACQAGIAYVEFALSISLLMILFLGSVEVTRAILIVQKLEKTVTTVTDVVTQADTNTSPLTTTEMTQLMGAVTDMMSPYTAGVSDPNIVLIITDVTATGTNNSPVINWQYCGGGTLSATSRVGSTIGGAATLPNSFAMTATNNGTTQVVINEVVIGEVFYNFSPLAISRGNNMIGAIQLYKTGVYIPRLGALTSFSSHC